MLCYGMGKLSERDRLRMCQLLATPRDPGSKPGRGKNL